MSLIFWLIKWFIFIWKCIIHEWIASFFPLLCLMLHVVLIHFSRKERVFDRRRHTNLIFNSNGHFISHQCISHMEILLLQSADVWYQLQYILYFVCATSSGDKVEHHSEVIHNNHSRQNVETMTGPTSITRPPPPKSVLRSVERRSCLVTGINFFVYHSKHLIKTFLRDRNAEIEGGGW